MSLTGFTHVGTLTLPTLAGTHTDFPYLLRFDDFHPDVIAALKSDGSDLRLSLTDDTQIAAHVVRWDPAANDILVHLCVPSAASATEIKIWGNSAASTLPASDTYGQYAAYTGFVVFAHDGKTNVANSKALNPVGTTLDASPFSGDATNFDGVDDRSAHTVSGTLQRSYTFTGLFKLDTIPSSGIYNLVSTLRATNIKRMSGMGVNSSGQVVVRKGGGSITNSAGTTVLSTGVWNHIGVRINGWQANGAQEAYLNGALEVSSNPSVSQQYMTKDRFSIGANFTDDYFDGSAAHVGIIEGWRDPEWFADHAANLTAIGASVVMTSVGGSTPVLVDIINSSYGFSLINNLVSNLSSVSAGSYQNLILTVDKLTNVFIKDKHYQKDNLESSLIQNVDVTQLEVSYQSDNSDNQSITDGSINEADYSFSSNVNLLNVDSDIKSLEYYSLDSNPSNLTITSSLIDTEYQSDRLQVFLTSVVDVENIDISYQSQSFEGEVLTTTVVDTKDNSFSKLNSVIDINLSSTISDKDFNVDFVEVFNEIVSKADIKESSLQSSSSTNSLEINSDTNNLDLSFSNSLTQLSVESSINEVSYGFVKSLLFYNLVEGVGVGSINISPLSDALVFTNTSTNISKVNFK